MMIFLYIFLFQVEEREIIKFLPDDKNASIEVLELRDLAPQKFSVIAEFMRRNFDLNFVIKNNADVEVRGNFSDITVNEFLTYIIEEHDLHVKKVGNIYELSKPDHNLIVAFEKDKITVQAKNVPIGDLVKKITEKSQYNVLVDPNLNLRISGYILELPLETGLNALLAPYEHVVEPKDGYFQIRKVVKEQPKSPDQTSVPEPEYPKMDFENEAFVGMLRTNSMTKAVEILANTVAKPFKFLDADLPPGQVNLLVEGRDFKGAMNALFLGTLFSYKEVEGVVLVGKKDRPELTTSQMIPIKHMNAQNILAYITGEMGLFQTFNLPSRPSTFGNFNRNSSSRFREGYSERNLGFGQQQPQQPIMNQQNQGNVRQQLTVFGETSVDLTLIREQNSILITATQDVIDEVKSRIELLDHPVPQVLVEALVVDFKTDAKDELGVNITNGSNSYFPGIDIGVEGNRGDDGKFRIGKLPSNFGLKLKALAEQGKARIISKPLIATLSGHEAYIEVGLTQSFKLTSENLVGDETPRSQTSERIETIEANISLRVIPWVTADGEITTYIEPVFNSFLGTVEDNVPPPISTRRLQSTVRLKDGETIILGGLIEESLRRSDRGVPGISRVPILGHLFKNFNREYTNAELVIYLTPHVYYGNEGSAIVIKHDEGMDYPLDVQEQQEKIKKKKKRWWHRKK